VTAEGETIRESGQALERPRGSLLQLGATDRVSEFSVSGASGRGIGELEIAPGIDQHARYTRYEIDGGRHQPDTQDQ